MRLILASQSPRRYQLLSEAGYEFEVVEPHSDAESGEPDGDSTSTFATRMAVQKAADVAARIEGSACVIGCDTVADCDGVVLGKPLNREHAESMLRLLSGRKHAVWSGLCLWDTAAGEFRVDAACSVLQMAPLTDEMIKEYLDSGEWQGKSGAFGYQDGLPWLELISGTASNVVGLPLDLLSKMLAGFDWPTDGE